jgi:hypothetical protein
MVCSYYFELRYFLKYAPALNIYDYGRIKQKSKTMNNGLSVLYCYAQNRFFRRIQVRQVNHKIQDE